MVKPNNLRKVSIARLKQEMQDTVFLSDDLAITTIDYLRNPTSEIPVSLDGFAAMIMMSGSAVLSIDTETYEVRPNMLVFFRPGSIIRTIRCSSDADGPIWSPVRRRSSATSRSIFRRRCPFTCASAANPVCR